jgi:pimeloyl-ACP methyl ester carboxylesterase
MRHPYAFLLSLALAAGVAATAATARAGVEDVKAPRGETVRLLVETGDNPWVTVVLFAGGAGVMDISEDGKIGKLGGNFLVRTRRHFRAAGAVTAVIDAPTDRRNSLHGFRDSRDHADDVLAVVRHLKEKYKFPVWLIGTSRGTESAANAGVRLSGVDGGPAGIVLTSSMLVQHPKYGGYILAQDLGKVTMPVLIAHHKDDACEWTPAAKVPAAKAALANARPVKALIYEGGTGIKGDACGAYHYHGYRGIELNVIADIMAWIRNPAP